MDVVLAGASGLIGSALRHALRDAGHTVRTLVRHPTNKPGEDSWDPEQGLLDPHFLAGADAVVCLSGVGVGDKRWTESYKRLIMSSRVDSVSTVARTIAEHGGPRVLVCASAVGYYGHRDSTSLTESANPGTSFLADVCVAWEGAAEPARTAGVRVVNLRTGLVLAADGGLLKRLVPLFKAGVGGRLGSGTQYMPWISLADEVGAIRFALEHDDVTGPVNLAAPDPATNSEFTAALGAAVHRPTLLPVPGFALRAALGEFAGEVTTGQRAFPARLLAAGYEFQDTDLGATLRSLLS